MSSLRLVQLPAELASSLEEKRRAGARIGFVPTMGALHAGHLELAARLRNDVDCLVVSIFVNPTQFGANEDFDRYPRDLEQDRVKLQRAGVDVLFAPLDSEMYPMGESTRVRVERLTEHLCGPFRPNHFEGVATVVAKLFAIVGPCSAAFGRKDFQQLQVIRRMARDLFFPVTVVGVPIVREPDGLAMSSRNALLSAKDRARARAIPSSLRSAAVAYETGERRTDVLEAAARAHLASHVDRIDYVAIVDAATLAPIDSIGTAPAVLAVACHVGATRLIDNFVFGEDPLASLDGAK